MNLHDQHWRLEAVLGELGHSLESTGNAAVGSANAVGRTMTVRNSEAHAQLLELTVSLKRLDEAVRPGAPFPRFIERTRDEWRAEEAQAAESLSNMRTALARTVAVAITACERVRQAATTVGLRTEIAGTARNAAQATEESVHGSTMRIRASMQEMQRCLQAIEAIEREIGG